MVEKLGALNIRNIDPEIAGIIHRYKSDHGHKNVTQATECIVRQWAEWKGLKTETEEKKKKEMIQSLKTAESSLHELRLLIDTNLEGF